MAVVCAYGDLWSAHADSSRQQDDFDGAATSYRHASKCYSRSREYEKSAEALAYSAESQLRLFHFDAAFSSLQEAENLALNAKDSDLLAQIIDQTAVYLQELGRYDEAIASHRRAVRTAKRAGNLSQLQTSLHNLGEGLRRSGKYAEATKQLKQAEKIARDAHDVASALSSLHCRALAVQGSGRRANASRLFEACRREASRMGVWREYVSALEALANLAAEYGDTGTAERQYLRALAAANRHDCDESQLRISVNLAALLRSIGRHRRSRTLLGKHEEKFAARIDAYIYHAEFAAALDACRDHEKAKTHWLEGLRLARILGSHEYQQKCLTGLAESHLLRGDCESACRRYREAISVERDPEHRMELMSLVFEFLLNSDKEREAERIYVEASEFAMKHGLKEAYVDLHLTAIASKKAVSAGVFALHTLVNCPCFQNWPQKPLFFSIN